MQGCCVALELAARGRSVDLFDRAATPMTASGRVNEGKLHLGYVYANDANLGTARVMARGAFQFGGFLRRHLGAAFPQSLASKPFVYGVLGDSQLEPARIAAYLARVDEVVAEECRRADGDYLGLRSLPRSRPAPTDRDFDPTWVKAAFETPEVSVDTRRLADAIAERVRADPRILFHPAADVTRVSRTAGGRFDLEQRDGQVHRGSREVVNASWASRLAIDATVGLTPPRPWSHRFKLGFIIRDCGPELDLASATLVQGPFGDVVNFGDGSLYLSWYPACRLAFSDALEPPRSPEGYTPAAAELAGRRSLEALGRLMPKLARLDLPPARLQPAGGWIFAWGDTDIDDRGSQLHRRDNVGVHSVQGYHSINTGKYTLAPLLALEVCQRICGRAPAGAS